MKFNTISFEVRGTVAYLQMIQPEAGNPINDQLVDEFHQALSACEEAVTVVVIGGSESVFCSGADFNAIAASPRAPVGDHGPARLYELWMRLACGPFVSVAHVRGKANAGGVGFVAACDIVLADRQALFSLSELLFGLYPACVIPFLARRTGLQKAHYLTLTTQPISAAQALDWGLVDAVDDQSQNLVQRHLQRLRRLTKPAVCRYKSYLNAIHPELSACRDAAVRANREMFADQTTRLSIARYAREGLFPWET